MEDLTKKELDESLNLLLKFVDNLSKQKSEDEMFEGVGDSAMMNLFNRMGCLNHFQEVAMYSIKAEMMERHGEDEFRDIMLKYVDDFTELMEQKYKLLDEGKETQTKRFF